jgi:RNA polymerase sigma-70 factor (ECF subfamily)
MDANESQHALSDYAKSLIRYKARQLTRRPGFTEFDQEDLEQEMILDLLERLPKYDSSKATQNTFVARVIENKISKLIRYRKTRKRDYRCEGCSLNDEILDENEMPIERSQTISQDECDIRLGLRNRICGEQNQLQIDISWALSELPENLREIAECLKTKTITETAQGLNIPRATLYDSIKRLRLLFEDKDLKAYL